MKTTVTPAIEQVKVHQASLRIAVDMHLASIPVTVTGQYNIDSNCFYPSTVRPELKIVDGDRILADTQNYDLKDFCIRLDWEYSETHDLIQEAVEKRDR